MNKAFKHGLIGLLIFIVGITTSYAAITDNMVGCYGFESSGNLGDNLAQSGIDGTNNGASQTSSNCAIGNCADFEQSESDNIEVTNLISNGLGDGSTAHSVCMWFDQESEVDDNWFWAFSRNGVSNEYSGGVDTNAAAVLRVEFRKSPDVNVKDNSVPAGLTFFCYSIDANGGITEVHVDGTDTGSSTAATVNPAYDKAYLGALWFNTGLAGYMDGTLDEVMVWSVDKSANFSDVWNSGFGTSCASLFPAAGGTLETFTDITNNSDNGFLKWPDGIFQFTFNGTCDNCTTDLANVTFLVNGTVNQTFTNLNLSENTLINYSFVGQEEQRNFTFKTNGADSTNDTLVYFLYFDGINPEINISGFTNNSIYYKNDTAPNFFYNFTFADNNLVAANVTISNSTGGVIYQQKNLTITTNLYEISDTLDLNTNSSGQYTMQAYAADDHTKVKINPDEYHINYLSNGFDIDDLKVYDDSILSSLVYYDTEREDRFKFKIKFNSDAYQHSFYIEDSGDVIYRPDSGYFGHFVLWNTNRWLDLQSPYVEDVDAVKLANNKWYVTVYLNQQMDEVEFESIGDLNIVVQEYLFNISDSFFVKVFDNLTSTFLTEFTATLFDDSTSQTKNTTTGVIAFNLTSGVYNLTASADSYVTATDVNVTAEEGKIYNMSLIQANTFLIEIYDEETDKLISEDVTLEVIGETLAFVENYTVSNGQINIVNLTPDTYTLNYGGGQYNFRSYFVTLSNDTAELDLFTIKNTSSSLILFIASDEKGNPITNATLKIQRFFVTRSAYELVAMDTFDSNGESGAYIVPNDVYYKFLIEKGGSIIFNGEPQKAFSSVISLRVDLLSDPLFSMQTVYNNVETSLFWNNDTNIVTFTFNNPTNLVLEGCLEIEERKIRNSKNFSTCTSSASATLTFNMTPFFENNTQYIARGFVETNTTGSLFPVEILPYIRNTNFENFDKAGLYVAYLFVISFSLAGLIFNVGLSVIYLMLGMAVIEWIGISFFGWTMIVGFGIIGLIIAAVIKK